METECQALNRSVTPKECVEARKELPIKFCEGCDLLPKPVYTPSTYTIRLSNKLKVILIEKAKKAGIPPREYIVRFLSEKLLK